MRIYLSCQQALRPHSVPAYAFWERYFRSALAEAGHELVEAPGLDWAEGLTPMDQSQRRAWRERTWGPAVEFIHRVHAERPIDLFLSYLFPDQVEPRAVRTIRGLGIPTVNFFCDNLREFRSVPPAFDPFDLHWVPEAGALALYQARHLPYLHAPMPMWVPPSLRGAAVDEAPGAVFIGSADDLRIELLSAAVQGGLNVQIYGSGWTGAGASSAPLPTSIARRVANQVSFASREGLRAWARRLAARDRPAPSLDAIADRAHPALQGDEYFTTARAAEVTIGINRCPSFRYDRAHPLRYSRLRDIEAPMLGACYLTESAPGLAELYEIGSEIETYATPEELAEKAARLAAEPARRRQLRLRGQLRALNHHTIGRTLARIAERLSLTP